MARLTLLFCLLFFYAHTLYATQSLELVDLNAPKVWASETTSTYMDMIVDSPSGDGRSSSAPTTIYIPITDSTGTNENYSTLSYPEDMIKLSGTWAGYIKTNFYVTNTTGSDLYLYAAVQNSGTSYTVISNFLYTITNGTEKTEVWPVISMNDLCTSTSSANACSNNSGTTFEKVLVYFLSTDSTLTHNSSTTISDSTSTLFYRAKFSASYITQDVLLNEVKRGDQRLNLVYSAPTINNYNKTIILNYSSSQSAMVYGSAKNLGSIISSEDGATLSVNGYFTLKHLDNNRTYNVAMGLVDKYQFSTKISASLAGTPEEIEVFLKKQSCYLISAGFGEEHYVIEYFKAFRDNILLKNFLGKKFVSLYYKTAPQYAHYIYESPVLSATVRGLSYTLYFVFHYALAFLLGFFVLGISLSFLAYKNRRLH